YAGHDSPAKPDPTPFHLSLERLGRPPESATFVGNDPRCDIDGAHAAGMEAAWLRNGDVGVPERTPKYTVDSLEELFDSPLLQ
ncbi:MAG: HAD family hydrolase, partial [Halodesulfurarchaeum sp.]